MLQCVAPADVESSECAEPKRNCSLTFAQGGRLQPLLLLPAADPPPRRRLVPALLLSDQLDVVHAFEELHVIFGA